MFATVNGVYAQLNLTEKEYVKMMVGFDDYFSSCVPKHYDPETLKPALMQTVDVDDNSRVVTIIMDDDFAQREMTKKEVEKMYKKLRKALPKRIRKYDIHVISGGRLIGSISDGQEDKSSHKKQKGWWGSDQYEGAPWVRNLSRPCDFPDGLKDRHLTVWASHGRYFNLGKKRWEWQRVNLFGTNEDLFTQSFVVPYLIPMLERSGALVFTPRERDWQENCLVIDNDAPQRLVSTRTATEAKNCSMMIEYQESGRWTATGKPGFGIPADATLRDGDLPFRNGTSRQAKCVKGNATASVRYLANVPEDGDYAVYVSYQTVDESIPDANYVVFHDGQRTSFSVNQRMGGGTWVYLGTFHFSKKNAADNGVVVTNSSSVKGMVTTDAVRFGGGMGLVARNGSKSGLPASFEGARYYTQWAGAPYKIYSQRQGTDDYADDINARSLTSNWIAGGSPYVPDREGLGVPLELSLAIHSDAGFHNDFRSIYGSLGICTTDHNDGKLAAGVSRDYSKQFRDMLTSNLSRDIKHKYGRWTVRDAYDRNYSETRLPGVPSAILEMFSHQSFPDMKLGHDPEFKFTLARSVYKTVLKFTAQAHGKDYVVAPLPPAGMNVSLQPSGLLTITWKGQTDDLEPTAMPTSFIVYMSRDGSDYGNGQLVFNNSASVQMVPGSLYKFRITAVNSGGESMPSSEIAAVYQPGKPMVMVVDGFTRLASPQVIDEARSKGFNLAADAGLSYGKTPVWAGQQQEFEVAKATGEGPGTFGYCGSEMEGTFLAGNDFNHATTHVSAIAASGMYSAVSCTADALPSSKDISKYPIIDLVLGNQRNDGYSLSSSPALTPELRKVLSAYKGKLIVSGSYVGSDAASEAERSFLADRLHVGCQAQNADGISQIHGMGTKFDVYRTLNSRHYASTHSDVLTPVNGSFAVLAYSDGTSAAVSYDNATFVMGFPFECIVNESDRNGIMKAILTYLQAR